VTKTIGRDENGKPIRKSFYGKTRIETIAKCDEYTSLKKQGLQITDTPTVKE
jgi:hypothetical protein